MEEEYVRRDELTAKSCILAWVGQEAPSESARVPPPQQARGDLTQLPCDPSKGYAVQGRGGETTEDRQTPQSHRLNAQQTKLKLPLICRLRQLACINKQLNKEALILMVLKWEQADFIPCSTSEKKKKCHLGFRALCPHPLGVNGLLSGQTYIPNQDRS